jgi:Pyruvate/2-oxoacid:ferredoxin oxidoreductase gamma subunit
VHARADSRPAPATPRKPPSDALPAAAPDATLFAGWPERAEIGVAGSAGERIRSAVGVIGEILVAGDLECAQLDDYPITVRKGHSISNLIVARAPIRYTGLREPDLLIIQSDDGLRRWGPLDKLPSQTLVIAAADLTLPPTAARVVRAGLKPLAAQVQRENVALALLAQGVVARGWMTRAALRAAADVTIAGKFRDANLRAIEAGLALAE